ncbi:MAG: DUF1848 domain-containing protein [Caldiserica bacterium]|jgi:hypothetical protein|nr:DUF1848 domain-containing protein [Caldisericota bacterium]MDH7562840.1 DUF1848 domain-containing protein [Caldisericota bacterium]
MGKLFWNSTEIKVDGQTVKAIEPLIISASRSTDIPAFYSAWLITRLEKGYAKWINPFNQKPEYVSLKKARVFVFWSKNPQPLIEYLPEFDKRNIGYYFQFTLNDYEKEGLEPHVPPLKERLSVFKELSEQIGKEKVIWRFDPLILGENLTVKNLLEKIERVGEEIYPYTEKLVFSFADIKIYPKVQNNLKRFGFSWTDWTPKLMEEIAEGIMKLNSRWGLTISTCAEEIPLEKMGIIHNKCIDDDLMARLFPGDFELMSFIGYEQNLFGKIIGSRKGLKDPGQRKFCGCIISKDIGQYNTCPHLCVYCYANCSPPKVKENYSKHSREKDSII